MRRRNPDDDFVELVCDQLAGLDGIAHRPMFGGYGLYCGSTFFGIVYRAAVYFKTSAASRNQYLEWGMEPFQPNAKQQLRAYYEVPGDVIEDSARFVQLANEAIDAALSAAE